MANRAWRLSASESKIGKYQILKRLAAGGMGDIFIARVVEGPGAGRILIIKTVSQAHGDSRHLEDLFRAEIQIMLGFSHQNIVTLLDVDTDDGTPFVVLEWIEGRSVDNILKSAPGKRVSPAIALRICSEVCRGLQYAHTYVDRISGRASPVIHRDVSPSNILVATDGNVKLIDFGVAKLITGTVTEGERKIVGKMHYLAPEQCLGERLDASADVFSLGVVLWEMLTGQRLFTGENAGAILWRITNPEFKIPPPSSLAPNLLPEVDATVLRALSRRRDERFHTAAEFGNALRSILRSRYPSTDEGELSRLIMSLFGKEIARDRREIHELAQGLSVDPLALVTEAEEPTDVEPTEVEEPTEIEVPNEPEPSEDLLVSIQSDHPPETPAKIELLRPAVARPSSEVKEVRSPKPISAPSVRRSQKWRLIGAVTVLLLGSSLYFEFPLLTAIIQGRVPAQAVISNACGLSFSERQKLSSWQALSECAKHFSGN